MAVFASWPTAEPLGPLNQSAMTGQRGGEWGSLQNRAEPNQHHPSRKSKSLWASLTGFPTLLAPPSNPLCSHSCLRRSQTQCEQPALTSEPHARSSLRNRIHLAFDSNEQQGNWEHSFSIVPFLKQQACSSRLFHCNIYHSCRQPQNATASFIACFKLSFHRTVSVQVVAHLLVYYCSSS